MLGIPALARSLGYHGLKEFVKGRSFVNTVEVDLVDSFFNGSTTIEDKQRDKEG